MSLSFFPMAFSASTLAVLAGFALIAGLVRGFAGFGAGLIFVPAASVLVGPQVAVIILWAMDTIPSLPIVLPALKKAEWKSVLPVALGYAVTVALGVYWLKHGDPLALRWAMSAFILISVVILWSGWRYRGSRPFPLSLLVGGVSGIFGGAAQLPGPPVLVYWLAGSEPSWLIRANTIILFFLTDLFSGLAYWAGDVFMREAVLATLICAPVYAVGQMIGQRLFGRASEEGYRLFAFALILAVAVFTLPLFDGILR